ncbi:MAG: helix-turn-helix domain-containing protein [Deferribacteraceae bacterium]|jgi:transcriptional regulator with XRE-family HTH domain|nr:helix-turn-helix domain-containing protein [Deferribacteraceae bacterium]
MKQGIKRSAFIGNNIRVSRLSKNLTQEELAAKIQLHGCDISRGTLAKIEVGIRNLSLDELNALKTVLNISYDDLFATK